VDELPFAADCCPCVEKLRTCYQLLLASETVRWTGGCRNRRRKGLQVSVSANNKLWWEQSTRVRKGYGQELPACVFQRCLLTLFRHPLTPILPSREPKIYLYLSRLESVSSKQLLAESCWRGTLLHRGQRRTARSPRVHHDRAGAGGHAQPVRPNLRGCVRVRERQRQRERDSHAFSHIRKGFKWGEFLG
jgi:hypothetical protein